MALLPFCIYREIAQNCATKPGPECRDEEEAADFLHRRGNPGV